MNEPVEWAYEDGGPVEGLARLLAVSAPAVWGLDAKLWLRDQVARLEAKRVYEFIVRLSAGGIRNDDRATKALTAAGIDLELIDGVFYRRDAVSDLFDAAGVLREPAGRLKDKFAATQQAWEHSRKALADREFELAVSQAATALESVVVTISGEKQIDPGVKKLFPGTRRPLDFAIVQLHNFAGAMPGVRHGSARKSDLAAAEALGVCRAAAVYIVMLIDLDEGGEFAV